MLRVRELLDVVLQRVEHAPEPLDLLRRCCALRAFRRGRRRLQLELQPPIRVRRSKGERTDDAQAQRHNGQI